LFSLVQREETDRYCGEIEGSEYFWGDLCEKHIKYVRNFTFHRLNMLDVNPEMPYRLPRSRYVSYWFSTADAPDVHAFNRLLSRRRLDQLERDGGVCIVSTHLGKGFARDGKMNPETRGILKYLAEKPGWFVPVSDILDYLLAGRKQAVELGYLGRVRLETRFVIDKMLGAMRKRRSRWRSEGSGGPSRTRTKG